ncbi:hypothetical protein M7I_5005 [Glarea lozoyensis 74030]|uniref:YCII-related domain-containing protein n=1 Tax=Glarea lozoyensis (strain ATCC 74030 / MF5533) TaxID=1104152 RepID=H0EQQ1_GLAL7|nr:hypothetical protein M7I_5005 [Glarea lozoyensis 74030]
MLSHHLRRSTRILSHLLAKDGYAGQKSEEFYPLSISQFQNPKEANPITVPEGKFEWLVILPDGEGKFAKRMEVRPKHFEGLTKNVDNGFYKMGGMFMFFLKLISNSVGRTRSTCAVLQGSRRGWQANESEGAILDEVPKEGEAMGIVGSALVCVAASKEEIFEVLKNDIYAKNEVWDFSKM